YLGGRFTRIGPNLGFGVPVDQSTGALVGSPPKVDGPVYAATSDGAGGWYIGGDFITVGGLSRKHAAHIDSTGTVLAWNPKPNNTVRSIAVDAANDTVYLGGAFTK